MNAIRKNAQATTVTEQNPRWASVVARDPKADGRFYYSVTTTDAGRKRALLAREAKA